MAETISFALILTKNLASNNKKSILKMRQIEIEVEIKGGMDPFTIQQLRDVVSMSFKDRRTNLNTFIERAEKELARINNQKKRKARAATKLKQIDTVLKKFETNLTGRVNKFCEEEEQKTAEFKKTDVKFVVKCVWSLKGIAADTIGGITALFASAAVPAASIALAKSIVDLALDIKGLVGDMSDVFKAASSIHADLVADTKKIRAIKAPKPVGKSLVQNLSKNMELYESKMSKSEMQAKALAGKLDTLLKTAKKSNDLTDDARKTTAKLVKTTIEDVRTLGSNLTQGRKALKAAEDEFKKAEGRAKTDPASFINWALASYDSLNKPLKWCEDIFSADVIVDALVTLWNKEEFLEPAQLDV